MSSKQAYCTQCNADNCQKGVYFSIRHHPQTAGEWDLSVALTHIAIDALLMSTKILIDVPLM